MNLPLSLAVYLAVGFGEWGIALRRTLAVARCEVFIAVVLVFTETLLGFWVMLNFVRSDNWLLAISYAIGGAMGTLLVTLRGKKQMNNHVCCDLCPASSCEKRG